MHLDLTKFISSLYFSNEYDSVGFGKLVTGTGWIFSNEPNPSYTLLEEMRTKREKLPQSMRFVKFNKLELIVPLLLIAQYTKIL